MRATVLLLAFGLFLGTLGCSGGGGDGVTAEGKVVKDGAPHTLAEGEGISLTLNSDDGKLTCAGTVEKDGTFKLKGSSGGLVPKGKYKVAYTHYLPSKGTSAPTSKSTAEVWDLTSSKKDLVLDIGVGKKK